MFIFAEFFKSNLYILYYNMTKVFLATIMVISFFSFRCAAFAQTVQTVRGRVVEKNTQELLPGVNIVITDIDGQLRGASTDANGMFSIAGVPVGQITKKPHADNTGQQVVKTLKNNTINDFSLHFENGK